jgi:preprotein translocase subunit YajC
MTAIFLLPVLVGFYLLIIRPQRRRLVDQRSLLTSLQVGDEVMTGAGIIGEVVDLGDGQVSLEIAPGTVVRFALQAVVQRISSASTDMESAMDDFDDEGYDDGVVDLDRSASDDTAAESSDHEDAG